MSYAQIVSASDALKGQVTVGLVKKAAVVSGTATSREEKDACAQILSGTMPTAWITMVLIEVDIAGQMPTPTDAQIDTVINTGVASPAVASVWSFITKVKAG